MTAYLDRHAASIAPAYAGPRRPDLAPLAANGVRYALVSPHPAGWFPKPYAYASLGALARAIHRRRAGDALHLVDTQMLLHGQTPDRPAAGVNVYATDPETGDIRRYLGWAWLNGAGREVLQFAIALERGVGA